MPLLCVTVTGKTMAELRARRDEAARLADLVELRLDGVADPDPLAALAGRTRPVVVTCRPVWEGGRFGGAEEERRRLLSQALAAGAEYIDVELAAGFREPFTPASRDRVIASQHCFDGVPSDVEARLRSLATTGAGIIKLAVTPSRLSELLPLFDLRSRAADNRTVLVGMGVRGLPSRLLAARLRSRWTYAGLDESIGQLPAERMVEDFGFRHATAEADLYAVVGSPVLHSVSPAMHNAGFREYGVAATYVALDPADARDCMTFARRIGLKGASITLPYKVPLLSEVDDPDALTARVGALNTLRFVDRRCEATNTDVAGFVEPLARRFAVRDARVTILGAGGGARAAAVALADAGARLTVSARRREAAEAIATLAGGDAGAFPPRPGSWDVLVNATPVGMTPDADRSPVEAAALRGGSLVYDLVYTPERTRLLREAERTGCRTIGGLEMLVAQAEAQFAWWTGIRPRAGLFETAARAALARRSDASPVVRGFSLVPPTGSDR